MPNRIIQVFEHQTLRLGEQGFAETDLELLAQQEERLAASKFYTLTYRGVKFSHYVGVLQLGDLTIEILPKADAKKNADTNLWHGVLLDMLRYCRLLNVETLSAAQVRWRSNSILELYIEIFIQEVEVLLRKGLIKKYQPQKGQVKSWKGQVQVAQHIQHNLTHQERFFTAHEVYSADHVLHQILWKALLVVEALLTTPQLISRLQKIKFQFPHVSSIPITERHFEQLPRNRQTLRYQTALDIAQLLILNYQPDIRGGNRPLLAILFDMNVLFEEYIYQRLRRLSLPGLVVQRQQQKPFWNRRSIRPDIVMQYLDKTVVLDTKWKILENVSPAPHDVQQAFIYSQYFDAEKTILVYPKVHALPNLPPIPFQPTSQERTYFCELHFAEVVRNGKLNERIGEELLQLI